jgi:hypothetical protein
MPPAIQPIDALWHSLCPSFTRFSQTEAIPLLRGPQRRRIHRAAIVCAPTTLPIRFIALPQLRLATPTKSRWHRRAPQLSQSYQQSDETESVAIARKGSTAALYQQLRNVSARGNYAAVQLLVKALVLEHGENPNSQLYRALILANTCPDHGSAAEVERLLQEMEQEGTVPDSAIYHAVLKACRRYTGGHSMLIGLGPRNSPKLSAPWRNPGRTPAAMAHSHPWRMAGCYCRLHSGSADRNGHGKAGRDAEGRNGPRPLGL